MTKLEEEWTEILEKIDPTKGFEALQEFVWMHVRPSLEKKEEAGGVLKDLKAGLALYEAPVLLGRDYNPREAEGIMGFLIEYLKTHNHDIRAYIHALNATSTYLSGWLYAKGEAGTKFSQDHPGIDQNFFRDYETRMADKLLGVSPYHG